jgi:fucose 4-O-acetylase-like acetyltransferase
MERNRYADLLRVTAIIMVVLGHWLLTVITYRGGRLSGVDALNYVGWGRWVTLGWQVMPAFFLVGGYVDALAWTRHHERGESWTVWVRGRVMALLWPVTTYLAVAVLVTAVASLCGVNHSELAEAGHLVSLQLWFIPVYLLLIALTGGGAWRCQR